MASDPTASWVDSVAGINIPPALIAAVILLVVFALGGYAFYVYYQRNKREKFEATELDERIDETVIEPGTKWGDNVTEPFYYGVKKMGEIVQSYTTESTFEREGEDETVENYFHVLRPGGFIKKSMWMFTDMVLGYDRLTTYIIYPKKAQIGVNPVQVSDNLDLKKTGRVWRAESTEGYRTLEQKATVSLLEDVVNTFAALGEAIHGMNLEHTQVIARMKEYMEERKKMYQGLEDEHLEE